MRTQLNFQQCTKLRLIWRFFNMTTNETTTPPSNPFVFDLPKQVRCRKHYKKGGKSTYEDTLPFCKCFDVKTYADVLKLKANA